MVYCNDYYIIYKQPKEKKMEKIKIPTPTWVELYGELSSYVEEYGSIDCRFDDDGNRLEEYEGEYESIVDEVENIMSKFFIKGDAND